MVPRPSSPTSLLWAHQLKREHEHLLDRVKDIAKSQKAHDVKVHAIGASDERIFAQFEDMMTRIAAIEEGNQDVKELIEKLVGERPIKPGGGVENISRLADQIAALDSHTKKVGIGVQQTLSTYRIVIKKIEDLEAKVQKRERTETLRKNDPVDVTVLTRRLDAIESRRNDDAIRTKTLVGRMEALEQASQQPRSARFQAGIERLNNEAKDQQETARGTMTVRTKPDLEQESSFQFPCSQGNSTEGVENPLRIKPMLHQINSVGADGTGTEYPHSSPEKHNLVEGSPTLNAQLRRSVRTSQLYPEGLVRPMLPRVTTSTSMTKKGNIYAKIVPGAANSRKKRGTTRSLDVQQAMSRVIPATERAVPMPNPLKDFAMSFKHPKAIQRLPKSGTLWPGLPPQKRKRRQIPQVQDLDSFALMADFSYIRSAHCT